MTVSLSEDAPEAPIVAEVVPYRSITPEVPTGYSGADWEVDAITAQRLAESIPENTQRAYANVRRSFEAWCAANGRVAFPATAQTFAGYVSHLITRGLAPNTISQHTGAIRSMHTDAGYDGQPPNRAALMLLRGYRRDRAGDGYRVDEATPLLREELERCVATLDVTTFTGRRNQLVLVLGFAMMARREELVSLQLDEIRESPDGLDVYLRSSKTDKESEGAIISIPPGTRGEATCPVQVLRLYREALAAAGVTSGALFRGTTKHHTPRSTGMSGKTVNDIVHRVVRAAGLPNPEGYSAHSLRAGGLTSSLASGALLGVAATHGRWSPTSPVVIKYARAADRWRDNAMRGVL